MYECHITIEKPENLDRVLYLAKHYQWKTSYIQNDPLLGNNPYFYFTCHHSDEKSIFEKMDEFAWVLSFDGVKVLRQKIEKIIYDTKKDLIKEII